MTETQIVTAPAKELRLFAQSPDQLVNEQRRLIDWCDAKMASIVTHRAELQENLESAKRAKWRTSTLKRAVSLEQKRIQFYGKLQDALRAGFFIVPNMQAEVFAVRTAATRPYGISESTWRDAQPPDVSKQILPAGDGTNVSSASVVIRESYERDTKNYKGEVTGKETVRVATADSFGEIDFPFSLARGEVLTATQQALAMKVFDEVAAVPPTRRADPMVIGRIYDPRDRYKSRHVTFLIAWFLDTETL